MSFSAINPSDISYNKDEETVTISFPSPLPLGNGQLFVDFTGELNDKMKGFYRSKYTGADGQEKYCAVTQFEVSLHNYSRVSGQSHSDFLEVKIECCDSLIKSRESIMY